MATKMGVHWQWAHTGPEDLECFRRWQPGVIKIINPTYERCRQAYEVCPDALYLLRDHALSEQHTDADRDPEGSGRRHAEEYLAHVREWAPFIPPRQRVYTALNEPQLWGDVPLDGTPQTYALWREQQARHEQTNCRYSVAFLDRLAQAGESGGVGNYAVGWPDNDGPDTPVHWGRPHFQSLRAALARGPHYLVLHEYFAHSGPDDMWRWWAGRWLWNDWPEVRIIIGEAGIDQYVAVAREPDPVLRAKYAQDRGWVYYLTGGQYLAQLARYDAQTLKDPRVVGWTPFTYDFSAPWGSFDLRPLRAAIIAYADSLRQENPMSLHDTLIQAAEASQQVRFNPGAALQRAIFSHNFVPNGPEGRLDYNGTRYAFQRAEHLGTGEVRSYYTEEGNWDNVRFEVR